MLRTFIISILVVGMLSGGFAGTAWSEEDVWSDDAGWDERATKPMHLTLDPVIETYIGIRVVDIDGSRRAGEYDFMHTRPAGGFKMHHYPLPHRYDLEFDFKDEKDISAEFAYMYKDILLLNYHMRGLWHNMGHEVFPEGPGFFNGSNDRAPGLDFGVSVTDNKVYLRLKWPDNPYHLFGSFRDFNKEGDIQQRYMVGWFSTGLQKSAQLRHVSWKTRTYTMGGNGHFGPVELQYLRGIKDFSSSHETELTNAYPLLPFGGGARAGGVYSHNVVPDLERTWDKVELHTSYTGRIVGSATYYHSEKKNKTNTAAAEANRATTSWTFIPLDGLTVALRYRFDRTEVFNPSTVMDYDHLTNTYVRTNSLVHHNSVSSDKHVGDAIVKYSPLKGVNLRASYRFEYVDKEHIYDWHITSLGLSPPDTSQKHTAKLFAWMKPYRMIDVKVGGEYSYCTDPALPVDYRTRYAANAKVGITPIPELYMNAYYRMSREENPFDYPGQNTNRDRTVAKDTAGVTLTVLPASWFSTSAFYNYDRSKIKTSMTWETSDPVDFFEHYTPSRDTSHVYGITAATSFEFPVNFDIEFHQCISRGRYFTTANTVTGAAYEARDIDDLVNMRLHETGGRFTTMLALPKGVGVDLTYEVNHFDDRENNPQYLSLDGTVHAGMLMVRKTW